MAAHTEPIAAVPGASAGAISGLPPRPDLSRLMMSAGFVVMPTRFLDACQRRCGDYFTLRPAADRLVVVTADPHAVKQVFTGDPDVLLAGEGNVVLAPILGSGSVLLLDRQEHLRHRRLLLPPFHGERMREYGTLMADVAERHVASWPHGRRFATLASMQAITLEVIMRAVFGVDDRERRERLGAPLRRLLDMIASRRRVLMLALTAGRNGPRSPWGRFAAVRRDADALLYEEIRARRADPGSDRDDIFSLLLAARDEDGQPLTDSELRDELMTLLVAGHETTATALAWTLERVVRHPEVLDRLQDEQRAGGEDYLDAVIKETLRLRPVVPAVVRRLAKPMEFGGWELPAGVNIAPSIYLLHRRADIYPEPLAFRPERFLEGIPGTYEWIPFGGGVRRCLGASFALFEMRVVLTAVLKQVRLRPTRRRPQEGVTRRAITFAPSRGGRIAVDGL
ncbi:MAG TPA: cytochrome P450 [Solirubrobacteraceae bacterium]|nr:cytochrome P450 [Solirubrobacteraceae bacterium]